MCVSTVRPEGQMGTRVAKRAKGRDGRKYGRRSLGRAKGTRVNGMPQLWRNHGMFMLAWSCERTAGEKNMRQTEIDLERHREREREERERERESQRDSERDSE